MPFSHWRDGRHVHVADAGHAIPADTFDRFIDEVTAFIADRQRDPVG